jgi:hypothetical protein
MIDLPTFETRLQLALTSIQLGDPGAYDVLLDLIDEASVGS